MNTYNNNNNNNNRRNNNQRRSNSRGGSGKNNGRISGPRPRNFDDENISPQQKRHFINKRDTHLSRGKELRANGDRIEAENEFQHAEHYTRMIKIADDQQVKYEERKSAESGNSQENSSETPASTSENSDNKYGQENLENVVENSTDKKPKFAKKRPIRSKPMPSIDSTQNENNSEVKSSEIAELPFMQAPEVAEKPTKKAD